MLIIVLELILNDISCIAIKNLFSLHALFSYMHTDFKLNQKQKPDTVKLT